MGKWCYLKSKVLTLNERYDISLKECMNETGVVQLKRREFVRIPTQGIPRAYYQMLERVRNEHLWQEKIKWKTLHVMFSK